MPYWLLKRTVRLEVYDMCIFGTFLLLMKLHVLDKFLAGSIHSLSKLFRNIVAPLSPLLY
jgi:hypothetical protein